MPPKDKDLDFGDGKTLCLLVTVIFTSFFVSLFSPLVGFGEALFATVSLPVTYTFRYFQNREAVALGFAYVFGYLIFLTATQSPLFGMQGMIIYTIAFIVSMLLRACIWSIYTALPEEFDKNNPAFAFVVAVFLSAVFSAGLVLWTGRVF
jgi:hypothetical protein